LGLGLGLRCSSADRWRKFSCRIWCWSSRVCRVRVRARARARVRIRVRVRVRVGVGVGVRVRVGVMGQ
jgi:hypothetical protein